MFVPKLIFSHEFHYSKLTAVGNYLWYLGHYNLQFESDLFVIQYDALFMLELCYDVFAKLVPLFWRRIWSMGSLYWNFVSIYFCFKFVGALLPWKIIQVPHGELAAPTNDINTIFALALLMSVAYFYAGLHNKGLGYYFIYIKRVFSRNYYLVLWFLKV